MSSGRDGAARMSSGRDGAASGAANDPHPPDDPADPDDPDGPAANPDDPHLHYWKSMDCNLVAKEDPAKGGIDCSPAKGGPTHTPSTYTTTSIDDLCFPPTTEGLAPYQSV